MHGCGTFIVFTVLFKLFLPMFLIIGGAVCGFSKDTCSEPVGVSLIGMGVGLFVASLLSFVLERGLMTLSDVTQRDLFRIRIFIGIKLLIALVVLIVGGSIYKSDNVTGSGLIGTACGIIISSLFSTALIELCIFKYCIPR